MMATPVPEDPLPTSPYARAAASTAAARRKLAATPRREDYDELHAEREAFERHVRSLMAKKARKDAARAAVALAAHERTVERASRRKAEIDARRGLAARAGRHGLAALARGGFAGHFLLLASLARVVSMPGLSSVS